MKSVNDITIVVPCANYEEENNRSIGIGLVHGEHSFLFKGDAETVSEEDIRKSGTDISACVHKVSHHCSSISTIDASEDFKPRFKCV